MLRAPTDFAPHVYLAGFGGDEARNSAEQRSLSGSVWAEHQNLRARGDVQAQVFEGVGFSALNMELAQGKAHLVMPSSAATSSRSLAKGSCQRASESVSHAFTGKRFRSASVSKS